MDPNNNDNKGDKDEVIMRMRNEVIINDDVSGFELSYIKYDTLNYDAQLTHKIRTALTCLSSSITTLHSSIIPNTSSSSSSLVTYNAINVETNDIVIDTIVDNGTIIDTNDDDIIIDDAREVINEASHIFNSKTNGNIVDSHIHSDIVDGNSISTSIVNVGDDYSLVVLKSQSKHFRARCRLSILNIHTTNTVPTVPSYTTDITDNTTANANATDNANTDDTANTVPTDTTATSADGYASTNVNGDANVNGDNSIISSIDTSAVGSDDHVDRLEYFIYDKGQPSSIVKQYPIANEVINVIMPCLLRRIQDINGDIRACLRGVAFLSTLFGDVLVTLIYDEPLVEKRERWMMEANVLREMLIRDMGYDSIMSSSLDVPSISSSDVQLPCGPTISIMGRSKHCCYCVGNNYVTERFELPDGRVLWYRQPEGAFSNPNPGVSRQAQIWLSNAIRSSNLSVAATKSDGSTSDDAHAAIPVSSPSQINDLRLLELYCGGGNHTVALAPLTTYIVAVELSASLCAAARLNLQLNGITNATVYQLPSEKFAYKILRDRTFQGKEFNWILVDPPRAGLDSVTLKLVAGFEHVIYISCNPIALARDLQDLQHQQKERFGSKYEVLSLAAMDQFPYSPHLEVGIILHRRLLTR